MSNCICATTRPKSGMNRPNTPASLIQRSTVSGSWRLVSTEEQRIGARILAHGAVDQSGIAPGLTHGLRVDFHPVLVGHDEDLDQAHRVFGKEIVAGHRDLVGHDRKPADLALAALAQRGQQARLGAGELLVELGHEHAGQRADLIGLEEEELHEPLDRACPDGRQRPCARPLRAEGRRSGGLRRGG
jgi:hypothetical protein